MRKLIPYLLALFVAGMIIAGAWLFVSWTRLGIQKQFETFKARLLAMQKNGTLPDEWRGQNIENLDPSQVTNQLSPDAHGFMDAADFLIRHSTLLIAMTVALCLVGAFTFNRLRGGRYCPEANVSLLAVS